MAAKKRLVSLATLLGALFLLSTIAVAGDAKLMLDAAGWNEKGNRYVVNVSASGLKAGQEVGLRTQMGGVLSDVSFLAKPAIEKADDKGMVKSKWQIRDRTVKRLLKPGEHSVMLVDADGNTLASAKLMVTGVPKKK